VVSIKIKMPREKITPRQKNISFLLKERKSLVADKIKLTLPKKKK